MTSEVDRARRAQAGRHVSRPEASARAGRNTNVALDFHLRRGEPQAALGGGRPRVRAHASSTQQVPAYAARAVGLGRPSRPRLAHHPHRLAEPVVRAHRDRAPARLAGEPRARASVPFLGGGFGAKVYIKLEALVAALSLIARRPVKISLTMEEQFYTITKHADHLPHQERRDQRRPHRGARMRGLVERRRLRRHRPARDAEIRLHRAGPYDIEHVRDRFVRALHQPAARRRAARLRHSAVGVGLREPHRPDRARARHRSDRIPPQNLLREGRPQATGTVHARCGDRAGARHGSPR